MNPRRAEHFDDHFTRVPVAFTPPDDQIIGNLRGDEFGGFSCRNPHFEELTRAEQRLLRDGERTRGMSLDDQGSESQRPAERRSASVATDGQLEAMRTKGDIFFDF